MESRLGKIALVAAGLAIALVLTGPTLGNLVTELTPDFAIQRSVAVLGYELTFDIRGRKTPEPRSNPRVFLVQDARATGDGCEEETRFAVIVIPHSRPAP